jgi:hypothetical protein
VAVMDSWASSPTAALAAVSAALLTPTHRPPPVTSMVFPGEGCSVEVAGHPHLPTAAEIADLWVVDHRMSARLVVSPLAHASAEAHHVGQPRRSDDAQLASQGSLSSTKRRNDSSDC